MQVIRFSCSGEGSELHSNKLYEKVLVIGFGVIFLSLVVLVLACTVVTLCKICASERRELRMMSARANEVKRTNSSDPETGDYTRPREGNVKVGQGTILSSLFQQCLTIKVMYVDV